MSANMIAGYCDLYWLPYGDSGPTDANDWLGSTEGLSYTHDEQIQEITGDPLGPGTVMDSVYQGGNWFLEFTVQEIKLLVAKRFLNPFTQSAGESVTGRHGYVGTPGILGSSVTGVLEAIPRTSTPAASLNSSGGSGFRFYGHIIGPRRYSLTTVPRFVPVRFRCYPFTEDAVYKWYKQISAIGASL